MADCSDQEGERSSDEDDCVDPRVKVRLVSLSIRVLPRPSVRYNDNVPHSNFLPWCQIPQICVIVDPTPPCVTSSLSSDGCNIDAVPFNPFKADRVLIDHARAENMSRPLVLWLRLNPQSK